MDIVDRANWLLGAGDKIQQLEYERQVAIRTGELDLSVVKGKAIRFAKAMFKKEQGLLKIQLNGRKIEDVLVKVKTDNGDVFMLVDEYDKQLTKIGG